MKRWVVERTFHWAVLREARCQCDQYLRVSHHILRFYLVHRDVLIEKRRLVKELKDYYRVFMNEKQVQNNFGDLKSKMFEKHGTWRGGTPARWGVLSLSTLWHCFTYYTAVYDCRYRLKMGGGVSVRVEERFAASLPLHSTIHWKAMYGCCTPTLPWMLGHPTRWAGAVMAS